MIRMSSSICTLYPLLSSLPIRKKQVLLDQNTPTHRANSYSEYFAAKLTLFYPSIRSHLYSLIPQCQIHQSMNLYMKPPFSTRTPSNPPYKILLPFSVLPSSLPTSSSRLLTSNSRRIDCRIPGSRYTAVVLVKIYLEGNRVPMI